MRYLAFLFLIFTSLGVHAKEIELPFLIPDTIIEDSSLDSTAIVHFKFPNASPEDAMHINYKIGEVVDKHPLVTSVEQLVAEVAPGFHQLQFYYTSEYHEVYSSISVEAGKQYYYTVYFEPAEVFIMTEKPVIYLYPEKKQEVALKVTPKGDFTFTYPKYNDGWKVQAHPNGDLKIGNDTYKYLFWESSESLSKDAVNSNEGFVVAGTDVTEFLQEKLTIMGLNSREQADFITFWAPRMIQHSEVFLQFHFNESCDAFATLNITPKPNHVNRVYVVWQPVDQLRVAPKPQDIPTFDRSGFDVLEWGGQELPSTQNIRTL